MPYGRFEGVIQVEWLECGRRMALLHPFRYVDDKGLEWNVPAGYVTDGASIPQFLWGVAGGPFSGKYRKAAVVHDVYCDNRARSWEATHLMFWQAMLCAGVGEGKAEMLYRAVYLHGPRWDEHGKDLDYEYVEEW